MIWFLLNYWEGSHLNNGFRDMYGGFLDASLIMFVLYVISWLTGVV